MRLSSWCEKSGPQEEAEMVNGDDGSEEKMTMEMGRREEDEE